MNKFISTIRNIFSIEDLRVRILNTLLFLAVFRLGSFIVLPGVDSARLEAATSGIFGLLDNFVGGAFSKAAIFGLGIMPYITASIVLQLLTVTVPYFSRMQKEGESGRKKINQYTRVLTVAVCFAQAIGYISTNIIQQDALLPGWDTSLFYASSVSLLIAGTIFCMWLGERITEKGIGNGISMLIMIGIISRLPGAIIKEFATNKMTGAFLSVIELVVLFVIVVLVVAITQAVRRVPVQYARQMVGTNKVVGGQRQYIPLKLNSAGVMPIIFASSIMFLPSIIVGFFQDSNPELASTIGTTVGNPLSWQYNVIFAVLIIVFTFFYTAISINPNQISEDMRRNNGFIPGVKPGEDTTNYLGNVIDRITLPGAIFLAAIAILPGIAGKVGITGDFAQFFGGTSLLIMVGVVLDTLQQIESYLLMRHYEGMMKTDNFRSKGQNVALAS